MKKLLLLSVSFLFMAFVAKSQPVNFVWAKSMGGKGSDSPVGIAKDASGNIYITGEFLGTRNFGPYTLTCIGYSDIFVAKYSPTGVCQWAVSAGAQFSAAYSGKIAVDGNNVYVTGSFTNVIEMNGINTLSNGARDIFIAGIDGATGTCTWIDHAGSSTFDDIPYGIETASGGGFFLCGSFTGTATFGSYTVASSNIVDMDIFYAKYSNTGTCTWVNRIGNTGSEFASAIKELPSGELIMAGTFEGSVVFGPGFTLVSAGGSDTFLAKFSSAGVLSWATAGGSANTDIAYGVGYDIYGNFYTSGFISDTADFGTIHINNPGGINVYTAKYNSTGACQWLRMGGAASDDIAYDMVTDSAGSSYVTGYILGDCYFGSTQVSGVNGMDVFIVKYDLTGYLRWITRVGGNNEDKGKAILLENNGFCHVAGDFMGNVVFGSTGLTADPGMTGIFLTRVGGGALGVNEVEKTPFTMYPNPSNDFVYLNLDKITDDAFTISIVSIDGREVQLKTITSSEATSDYKLDLKNIAKGSYMVKVETSKGDFTRPLIVQ